MHDGQTENSKRHPPINLKEPERELTVPQEWGNPSLLFLPLFPHAAHPAQAPVGIYRSPTLREGNFTLHLKELRCQEDGQTPSALIPLSALMPLGSIVGTVTHVAAIAG